MLIKAKRSSPPSKCNGEAGGDPCLPRGLGRCSLARPCRASSQPIHRAQNELLENIPISLLISASPLPVPDAAHAPPPPPTNLPPDIPPPIPSSGTASSAASTLASCPTRIRPEAAFLWLGACGVTGRLPSAPATPPPARCPASRPISICPKAAVRRSDAMGWARAGLGLCSALPATSAAGPRSICPKAANPRLVTRRIGRGRVSRPAASPPRKAPGGRPATSERSSGQ